MSSLLNEPDGSQASYSLALLPSKPKQTNTDDRLVELTETLEAIDESSPLAKLNIVSISDNNGGRIFF